MQFLKSCYIHNVFFKYLALLAGCFVISYWFPFIYPIAWILTLLLLGLFLFDIYLLYGIENRLWAQRILPLKLSNSDDNIVRISLRSSYRFKVFISVIDELPIQFQKRDFDYRTSLTENEKHSFQYIVRPVNRGEYIFGNLNIFVSSPFRIVKRKFVFQKDQMVPVYPSIIQMQRYDFLAIDNRRSDLGLKKIRRIGHTQEFEQIKEYVRGDDFRTVNWKATAKHSQLMVNQYQDERSQPVYSILDTGRVMKMPFEGLKLLDYAINSTLAFSNVALKRKDKTGLLTFSKKIETFLPAIQKAAHLNSILEKLYGITTQYTDSDFGLLYTYVKRKITQRSLLLLYTNFEHISALERQLPYLLALSKKHVLVVIFFENTELEALVDSPVQDLQGIYQQTIAEKFVFEKQLMQKRLRQYGIQTILTKPSELTIQTINKYLEIKARGLL